MRSHTINQLTLSWGFNNFDPSAFRGFCVLWLLGLRNLRMKRRIWGVTGEEEEKEAASSLRAERKRGFDRNRRSEQRRSDQGGTRSPSAGVT